MVANIGKFPNLVLSSTPDCRLQFCKAFSELRGIDQEGYLCVRCAKYMRDGITFMLLGLGIHSRLSHLGFMLDIENVAALSEKVEEVPGFYLEQVQLLHLS